MNKSLILFLGVIALNCSSSNEDQNLGLITDNAMVVSARVEASAIGSAVMQQGGNAFDAMVSTELALAVAYPFAGNIGGGGFMVYRTNEGTYGGIDYREKAPMSADRDMYLDQDGNVIPGMSTKGATAIGVPGTLAGLFEVHEKFGSLPIEQLIQPVVDLAERGVVVTQRDVNSFSYYRDDLVEANGENSLYTKEYKVGDTIKNLAFANTLKRVIKNGRDEFYKGETAKILSKFVMDKGGYITEGDLAAYEAVWRQPVVFNYKDIKIISMSPPSSGGVTMNQIFKMIEPYNIGQYEHNSLEAIQLFTEAARRAYADRNYFLGDPDFADIPLDVLLSDTYLKERFDNFSFDAATPSSEVSRGTIQVVESDETTHYSIVDQFGNGVSVTTTLNGGFGSKLFCEELGIFLNNEMDDFSSKVGVPNMFGLIGAEANAIEPQKRMLSSMTPSIVEKDNELYAVVGTPGGSTIITAVAQTILNLYEFNMGMQEAVNAKRFHHQWLPDEIILEATGYSDELKAALEAKGYSIRQGRTRIIGKVDAIKRLKDGRLEAGADPRGDDAAVGF